MNERMKERTNGRTNEQSHKNIMLPLSLQHKNHYQ